MFLNFEKSSQPQVSSRRAKVSKQQRARRQAARLLKSAGDKSHDNKLALIAQQVQLDAFTKVKAAIDEMITELNRQQEDEVKHKVGASDSSNCLLNSLLHCSICLTFRID